MVGDAADDIAQRGLWVETVDLGGFDQGVDGGGAVAARIGPGEGPVLAAEDQRANGPFGGESGRAVEWSKQSGSTSQHACQGPQLPSEGFRERHNAYLSSASLARIVQARTGLSPAGLGHKLTLLAWKEMVRVFPADDVKVFWLRPYLT